MPLPDPERAEAAAAELERLGRAWGGERWPGPFSYELYRQKILSTENPDNARTSLNRWLKRLRVVPDDVLAFARELAERPETWILGVSESGRRYLVRRTFPRFIAAVEEDGTIGGVEWIDRQPAGPAVALRDARAELARRAG